MAHSDLERNTYEEIPDKVKELLKKKKDEGGVLPTSRPIRAVLLEEHERHLELLATGALPPRTFVLPLPYSPSQTSLLHAKQLHLDELLINTRKSSDILLLRALTDPYVHSSSIVIVEDRHGDVARLALCNLEDSSIDPVVTKGAILAIKQPCWSAALDGGYHIRVDHPSDVVFLETSHEIAPQAWKQKADNKSSKIPEEWKKEGDMMFLQKKFRKALKCYQHGVSCLLEDSDTTAKIDMYRKRCGVNIVLLRFDDAADDLAQAISIYAHSDSTLQDSELGDISTIRSWLHNHCIEDSRNIASQVPRPLKDLAARIKFDLGIHQNSPEYDLAKLSSYVGPLTLHVDAADYISDTKVKETASHGRGLFAKRDFKAGDLVMAEKAFALPGYIVNDPGSECSLYSLGNETATDRAGALLFKELVQKLDANPSLRRRFFDMDDGGYWAKNRWEANESDLIPVDIFRIEHIRRRNCFAAPIRAVDVLNNPNTPVRNGFWIHTSYINHSCLPNSVRTFMGDLILLRATRDISAGEEITAQYITPELTVQDRQQKYKETWGFECDCHLCEIDGSFGNDAEQDRMAIFEDLKSMAQKLGTKPPTTTALKKFAKRLRDLESLYSDDAYAHLPKLFLVHPTLFLTEAWRGVNNTDKTIEYASRLLRYFGIETHIQGNNFTILQNNGLVNVECVRALKYLAQGYITKGQSEVADSIMDVARVWFRIITGADVGSEQFLRL